MGLYLNPGNRAMRLDRRGDVYVDKSGLIACLNGRVCRSGDRYVCSSRPRRFGKTMAAHMLAAYYQRGIDSRPLFDDLRIAEEPSFERHLNAYDVVLLDMRQLLSGAGSAADLPAYITAKLGAELRAAYPGAVPQGADTLYEVFSYVLDAIADHPGFVFIIDEWDVVFREKDCGRADQEAYIGFLRDLLKDKTYVALAYMTGILPIKKYGTHSVLNMFDELSMIDPGVLAPFVGFTEAEVAALCTEHGMDFSEVKSWYDGYLLGGLHVYNPRSVVKALQEGRCGDYWTSTESYEALQVYLDLDYDGLRQTVVAMLAGEPRKISTLTFANDMGTFKTGDDVLTLLVHLGYLGYDQMTSEAFVPNEEIRRQYVAALSTGRRTQLAALVRNSDALLRATLDGNETAVAAAIQSAHESAAAPLFYNDEQALRAAVKLAFISCVDEYAKVEELPSGRGCADVVWLPRIGSPLPALVVELKWNRTAGAALAQIRDRDYPAVLREWGGPVVLVGISYDERTKEHTVRIECLAGARRASGWHNAPLTETNAPSAAGKTAFGRTQT